MIALLYIAFSGLVLYWVTDILRRRVAVSREFRDFPCGVIHYWFDPLAWWTFLSLTLPKKKGDFDYSQLHLYEKAGTTIVVTSPLLNPRPAYWVADAAAQKLMGNERTTFSKNSKIYEVIAFWGTNIVSAAEDDWKRHRDVIKSAFGEANNVLVWQETTRLVLEWIFRVDEALHVAEVVPVDALAVMTKLSLLVVSSAQFGQPVSFDEELDSPPPPGHKLSFRRALLGSIDRLIHKLVIPTWAYKLPIIGKLQVVEATGLAFGELRQHLTENMETLRAEPKDADSAPKKSDIFRLFLRHNDQVHSVKAKLSDDEIMSNLFAVLFAGYKTTATTLTFALLLLALHPEVQERLQHEIDSIWGSDTSVDSTPSYRQDVPRLKYTEAVFRETLRLFPAVSNMAKVVAEDTTITGYTMTGSSKDDKPFTLPLPKGSPIWMEISSTHRLKKYWGKDASEFRPERFLDTDTYSWPRDAFLPFGTGVRSCIGARFATLEGLCVLAHIAYRYDILLPPDIQALPKSARRNEMLHNKFNLTQEPTNPNILLRKRHRSVTTPNRAGGAST